MPQIDRLVVRVGDHQRIPVVVCFFSSDTYLYHFNAIDHSTDHQHHLCEFRGRAHRQVCTVQYQRLDLCPGLNELLIDKRIKLLDCFIVHNDAAVKTD